MSSIARKLGDVVSFKGGGTPSTERSDFWGGDIPWVSPKDMKFAEISDAEDKITLSAIANSATNVIPVGACLVVVRSGILVRTVPIGLTTREVAINQDIKALCPEPNLLPKYLYYFLRAAEPHLLTRVTRGATVHRLSTEDLRNLEIFVPSISEQTQIVASLDESFSAVEHAKAVYEQNLRLCAELRTSLLIKAFSYHFNSREVLAE